MKKLIKNNKNCLFLFEAQTGDTGVAGNRGRGFFNGRFVSASSPTLDTTKKAYGSQSWAFSYLSNQYLKSWRNPAATISSVTANNTFTINSSTNYTTYFIPNKVFTISGATNNNGTYSVASSSNTSNITTVIVHQNTLVTGGTLGIAGHTNLWASIGTGNFTFEALFFTPSSFPSSYHDICGCDFNSMFSLEIMASYPKLIFWIGGSSKNVINPIALNTLYHFLAVRNSGVLKLWLNGVLVFSGANTASLVTNNDFYIGCDGYQYPDATTYYQGNIQRIGLWSDVLYWNQAATTGKTHFNHTYLLKNFGSTPNQ